MRSFTAIVSGEVVQHAKVGPMLVSNEPHVQPVERGEVPSKHMSQLKLRNGGGRPFGGHARRSTKALATRRCRRMLIMSASSVVMRGKRGMPVCDEGAKGGAAGRSVCRMHRCRGDDTQMNRFYMRAQGGHWGSG